MKSNQKWATKVFFCTGHQGKLRLGMAHRDKLTKQYYCVLCRMVERPYELIPTTLRETIEKTPSTAYDE